MTTVCVPVCMRRLEEIRSAIERALDVGDFVELRLDCLSKIPTPGELDALVHSIDRPTILTLRSAEQGGHSVIDYERRREFWSAMSDVLPESFVDIELDLVEKFASDVNASLRFDWRRVICSCHDFSAVPTNLDQLYDRMAVTPAQILKVAVHADDAIDCLPIFNLLDRARTDGHEMIAIAMGEAGIMTRILGPSRGSFLTYGSLDGASTTAPGQLTARELREVYRIDRIDGQTGIFGIIGNPVSHSFSPLIHNAAFAAANINGVFVPFEVRDLAQFMRRMAHPKSREIDWNLGGFSVTAPHKSAVMRFLDWIESAAKEVGAVNTIVIREDQLLGYNTDAAGFMTPLRERFEKLDGTRCAIIGAGGAARSVLWALRRANADATLFARDAEKAKELARQFEVTCISLEDAALRDFDIVVNCTPLGTRGSLEAETAATADQLRGVRLAYDLVYNPTETRFIRQARAAGCETIGGIEMLLAQAIEQFKLWTGQKPEIKAMRAALIDRTA